MRIQITPCAREGVNPFEILHGRLHPINTVVTKGDQMHVQDHGILRNYLLYLSLSRVLFSLHGSSTCRLSLPLDVAAHSFQSGDAVYIQTWKDELLVGKKMFLSNVGAAAYELQWETEDHQHLSILAPVWGHLSDVLIFGAALEFGEVSGYT